jgi:methionyl-tRNA formyltransferase
MRVVLITQDDPFYLAENINYLIESLPKHSEIVGCVLFNVSPFGKKLSILEQAKDTFDTFGLKFFIYFGWRYMLNKLNKEKSLRYILTKHNIPIIALEKGINDKSSIDIINNLTPELLVSIGGNQIFKKPIIELAPKGCLNLHTALLPKYRGLMPSFWVLKNNEKETGVSVFFVDEGIDSGPILVQKRVAINDMTQDVLIKFTKKIGMEAILESIEKIHNGNFNLIPNPKEEMTYFSKPTRKDVEEFLSIGKKFF